MRSLFAAALIAVANAGKVHQFFAENNFICEMCQDAVKFAEKGMYEEIDSLYKLFPVLEERIMAFSDRMELVNLNSPFATCQNLSLCEKDSVAEMLYAEQPKDL